MNVISDPTFIVKNIDPQYTSLENRDYDFVNNWIDVSVENEVWRGKKLREGKPIPIKIKDDYDVINIDYLDPVCNAKRQRRR